MTRVPIIGGGIHALACAVALKERGVDFTIFGNACVFLEM